MGGRVRVKSRLVLDACRWHVEPEAPAFRQRALEHFQARYEVLLGFLLGESLLSDPDVANVSDWPNFELLASDLTDEGLTLFRRCHAGWNPAFEQAHTQRHLIQWKRRLKEIRTNVTR